MTYNTLGNIAAEGLIYFIDDLNTRFTNLLFSDIVGLKKRFSGLARLDIIAGIPHTKDSNGQYTDALFDDNYNITTFFMESGDRNFKEDSTEATLDLFVSVNMDAFTGYNEEGIINAVYDVMALTSFEPETLSRDFDSLKGILYPDKTPDSMAPYFVFKISSKLLGNLN